MKILLIGNYAYNRQQSMERFAELMREVLGAAGCEVRLIRPAPIFGKLKPSEIGIGKWLGYMDRFFLFPFRLRREAAWADVVHICDQANAMYVSSLGGKPHVVTCHDMLAIRSALGEIPGIVPKWSGRIYQRWILSSLRRAQCVVCVSAHTRAELLRVALLPPAHAHIVPNALNYPYRQMSRHEALKVLASFGADICAPFILHVGGNQWYKNREGVVRIFAELSRYPEYETHRLVLVGKAWTARLRKLIEEMGLGGRVQELVSVCNEALRALYSTADFLLFPSLEEGFGWPIIEAQACSCPVVTSNRPPMTDVAGQSAVFIDPNDLRGTAARIVTALADRKRLQIAGLNNVTRYAEPRRMVEAYLSVYKAAKLSGRTPIN